MLLPFPAELRGIPSAVFPRSRESPGSSSRGLTPPSEYCLLRSRPSPSSAEHLPWGFAPPSRHQCKSPPIDRVSTPCLCSALSVSHALDGLLLFAPLRVCFTPQPRPRFALQGLFPIASRPDLSPCRSLLLLAAFSYRPLPTCARFDRLSFRALIRLPIRSHRRVV
mgnify:CR=1 FL=1